MSVYVDTTSKSCLTLCFAEYKPDLQLVDKRNRSAIEYAAQWHGLEGVKLLLQAGSPLPEGGVSLLVTNLRAHASMAKVAVSHTAS
jgi:hypothetical protein